MTDKKTQFNLDFGFSIKNTESHNEKTYRAIRHDLTRLLQNSNSDILHHPNQKINQIIRVFCELQYNAKKPIKTLELFSGQGNLTNVYRQYGDVDVYDKKHLQTGDSYVAFHKIIGQRKKYNVIDLDPYGFPNRFFPDVFLLIDNGVLFVTMPKPYVNILNGITQCHMISYYGEHNPSKETIIKRIALWGLCHWRKVELIDCVDCKSIWRMAFIVGKVKATEYTGVKNR